MLDQASQAVLAAESYARSANDLNALAAAENLLGGINFRQGKVDQAVSHTRQAMAFWQAIGYSWGVAVTLSNLGVLEVAGGNWQAAYDAMHESLQLRRDMGDVEGVAVNNNNLGSLCLDQGSLELAEAYLRASLAIARPFRLNFLAANSCHGMATTLTYLGKYEEVPDILNEGKRLADELKARDLLSELHRSEAEYFLAVGDGASALDSATQAVQVALETGNSLYQARGLRIAALAYRILGQVSLAEEKLQAAWQVLQASPDELETARWRLAFAMITHGIRPQTDETQHIEIARQTFLRLGASHDLGQLEAFTTQSGLPLKS
jgi:tetratricopeptide (TPR) repeat protein